jgi:hypothetical protein
VCDRYNVSDESIIDNILLFMNDSQSTVFTYILLKLSTACKASIEEDFAVRTALNYVLVHEHYSNSIFKPCPKLKVTNKE